VKGRAGEVGVLGCVLVGVVDNCQSITRRPASSIQHVLDGRGQVGFASGVGVLRVVVDRAVNFVDVLGQVSDMGAVDGS